MIHCPAHLAICRLFIVLAHVLFLCSTASSTSMKLGGERLQDNSSCSQLMDLTGDDTDATVGWMVSRSVWGAQQPIGELDDNKLPLQRVIVSHTLTKECYTLATCALQMRYQQRYAIESELWFDHPYNYMVGGDGRVYVGRGWDYMAAHTKHNNNRTVGIAFIGQFDNKMPNEKQVEAFHRLVATGVEYGKLSPEYKLQGQCQLRIDNSPGLSLMASMTSWPHYDHSLPPRCTYGGEIIDPAAYVESLTE